MKFKIAALAGDGVGPEVTTQAIKTLKAIGYISGHQFQFEESKVGACAIDEYGDPFPESTFENCLDSDAVLFGAIGDPKYDNDPTAKVRPEQGLLSMRKKLGLYANIRPIMTFPSLVHKSPLKKNVVSGADFVVVRELTGGIYFGQRGRSEDLNEAFDTMYYSKYEIERIIEVAIDYAKKRSNKITLVDKANVLASSRLWRETMQNVDKQKLKGIDVNYLFVDNAAMQIVQNPKQFDVIVTGNMFGDILSDEASVITGSIGLLPSASIGEKTSVFEPVHGSYPQGAGKDIANPLAAILSAAMLIEYLGMEELAQVIRNAVAHSLESGFVTEDLIRSKAKKCSEVGDFVRSQILSKV